VQSPFGSRTIAARILHLTIVAFSALLQIGCLFSNDGVPSVVHSIKFPSPDASWVAEVEIVDNGLGFGLGRLYEEIHVVRQGESVGNHGDPGASVVFYMEKSDFEHDEVTLHWMDSQRLRVVYGGPEKPGVMRTHHAQVAIEYQPLSRSGSSGATTSLEVQKVEHSGLN